MSDKPKTEDGGYARDVASTFMKNTDDQMFTPEERAHHAYQYADAMLKERAKP